MWVTTLFRRLDDAAGKRGGLWPSRPSSFRGKRFLVLLLSFVVAHSACTSASPAPAKPDLTDQAFVEQLEQRTFRFFWDQADPDTGLIPDRYPTPSFASIAAVGFGLTGYTIGAERGYVTRAQASDRVLRTLRFLEQLPQNADPQGSAGYKGFFYHFLDMKTGRRYGQVELSTIDTALLMAGAFTCQSYFNGTGAPETEIRQIVDRLNARIDWTWAVVRPNRISMGWTPEGGFNTYDWKGYMESMVMMIIALGSPTHPIAADAWPLYSATNTWATFSGQDYVNFGPLFGHQFSHVWIDFRGIRDDYMRARGIDYAENTRRATYAQRAYAVQNPGQWQGYGANMWGFSACDGPADVTLTVQGRQRTFQTYAARGVGVGGVLDDGTITPNAAAGSLPFTPEISLPALQEMRRRFGDNFYGQYGFPDAFNESYPAGATLYHGKVVPGLGWVDTDYLGLDQGLILTMLENYRSEMVWKLMKINPCVILGLKRAGFTGGWIDQATTAKQGPRKSNPQPPAH
jgi:hypothetical protein